VRREAHRGRYDRTTIDAVLDAALVCHLAFVDGGQPFAVPTLHARVGDVVYVHGSSAGRALRALAAGAPACLTATVIDGLVLARSVFEHSVDYRSAVLLGRLHAVEEPAEKLAALEAFTEKLLPGRWAEARSPSRKELTATSILAMPIEEASGEGALRPARRRRRGRRRATGLGGQPAAGHGVGRPGAGPGAAVGHPGAGQRAESARRRHGFRTPGRRGRRDPLTVADPAGGMPHRMASSRRSP
jgi:nitroimidazol reductase NimA-like FMN-containing flavoprotein (pyridoxamine 5'-phosphate oxidase superfamily)